MFRKQKKKSSKDWGAKTYRIVLVIEPLIVWRFLGDTLNHSFELQNRCVVFGVQKECWLFAPNHQKNIHDFLLKNNVFGREKRGDWSENLAEVMDATQSAWAGFESCGLGLFCFFPKNFKFWSKFSVKW